MANALINQKYANSLFDYFQSKAQQSFQTNQSNFLTNNTISSNSNNNHQNQMFQHYFQNNANTSNSNANYQNQAISNNNQSFLEEFKKPLPNFSSFIHETMHHTSHAQKQSSSNHTYSGGDLSSNSSSCGSENSGLDSLKETQMRISESCNLVNDM